MRRGSFTDAEVLSSFPKQECWSTALAVSWPWRDCGCFHLGQPCFEILELGHENICPPPAGAEGGSVAC